MDGYTLMDEMQCLARMTEEGKQDLYEYPEYRYLFGLEIFSVRAVPTYAHYGDESSGWEYHYTDEHRHLKLYPGEIEILEENIDDDSPLE
jgi:hypothetical protein